MEVLTKNETQLRFNELCDKVKQGCLFIYPTDTIYGIGCDATNEKAVAKLREVKGDRPTKAFSIIPPSQEWIKKNCEVDEKTQEWLGKLPGPFTIITPLKNKQTVAPNVAPDKDTIGIRIPDHWINKLVEKYDIPIITTSANKSGEPFMTKLENLDKDVEKAVEFMIYEGEKEARPSRIVNPARDEVRER